MALTHDKYWQAWDRALSPIIERPVGIIHFAEHPDFCGLRLFPRQKVLLKLYNGEELDESEIAVVKDWHQKGYVPPDIWDRLDRSEPFHEVVLAIGRRGSKSFLSGLLALYETYKLLLKDDPHKYYNLLAGDVIQVACVADSANQADETIFAKVRALTANCPWMMDRLVGDAYGGGDLFFQTNADRRRDDKVWKERAQRVRTASIQVRSYNAVSARARGRQVIVVVFDEIAHYQNRAGRDNAYNLYEALVPSVRDFGDDGRVVSISSPLYEMGQFYDNYSMVWSGRKPSTIGIALPSWIMYEDADLIGVPPKFTYEMLKTDNEDIEFDSPEWWR